MRSEDGSIIYECLNGEPDAFGMLVDKYKEGIYAREFSDDFPIQVADNLYMKGSYRDTIFRDIYASPLSGKKESPTATPALLIP